MNPYLLDLPAVVSFSGGRTSGYMLRKILDAHGGQPEDLKICFQNTGLEHAATYEFVKDCADRWGCDITWLEYCVDENNQHSHRVVSAGAASRDGGPFDALIKKKQFLPNPVARMCTQEMKVKSLERWMETFGYEDYTIAIGLRGDEPRRAVRLLGDQSRSIVCPLYREGVTEKDVLEFWAANDFDLQLSTCGTFSNCVGCMLKSRQRLATAMREAPQYFSWWIDKERMPLSSAPNGATFRSDRPSYAAMLETVQRQGVLPFQGLPDDTTIPCMCHD